MMDKKQVEKIAHLARIQLSEDEKEHYLEHFSKIIQYFNGLESLNTKGVEPMVTPHSLQPGFRPDQVKQILTVEELLQNAPDVKDSLFRVPPVV